MRVSEFQRYLSDNERESSAGSTRLSSLNPSLLLDLQRFARREHETDAGLLEVLEVLAAAVRHGRPGNTSGGGTPVGKRSPPP